MKKLRAVISVHTSEWDWRRERDDAPASLAVTSRHSGHKAQKYSAARMVSAGRERRWVACGCTACPTLLHVTRPGSSMRSQALQRITFRRTVLDSLCVVVQEKQNYIS